MMSQSLLIEVFFPTAAEIVKTDKSQSQSLLIEVFFPTQAKAKTEEKEKEVAIPSN